MRLERFLAARWPWRWARSVGALTRGVRLHPTAVLYARADNLCLGRGTVIGARTRVLLRASGRLVTERAVWISSDVEIQTDTEVRLGAGTTVQSRCTINGATRVGRGCIFAPNVFVSSSTHPFRLQPHLPIREQERQLTHSSGGMSAVDRPVWIQDDCWLGTNVVVCPGVTVGKGAILGANSVVVHDVAPYSVVAGAPARRIGERLAWRPPAEICADRAQDLIYVLSGVPVAGPSGTNQAVAATLEEPLRFTLAPGAVKIRVDYHASHDLKIRAGGREYEVRSGQGTLEVPAPELPVEHDAALLELKVLPTSDSGMFEVRKVAHAGGA